MSISSISANPSLLSSLLNPSSTSGAGTTNAAGTTRSSQAQTLQNFLDALTQALQQGTAIAATQGASSAASTANALAATLHHHHHHGQGLQAATSGVQGNGQRAWQATPAMGSTISVRA